ncbi:DUF72 domain-containing protein [Dactylosporangium matsuzakiense]|uniref:DUF72 domain-containing protein n=2 Tax=Dactylosporangium matsuzakiense TaxID=53360 RepID=A0A9W6KGF3_9ACTN|nr:hypothetical protein GCM10017581_019950 [Dactylosporangium matsuzakiense]
MLPPALHVGCAMWTLKPWQGRFFEHPLPAGRRLHAYAGLLNAVEGNTTFYATPSRATAQTWADQTEPDFRMVLKLPKPVTHEHRLTGALPEMRTFLDAIEPLGPRVHALWVQLPASFGPEDVPTLARFLRRMPAHYRCAVEVRHPALFTDPDLEGVLRTARAEWVPFDTTAFFAVPPTSDAERDAWAKKPRTPRRAEPLTAHPIVRYLGRDSEAETVAGWQFWVERAVTWLGEGRSPTFFIHTPDNAEAPRMARAFHAAVRARVPALPPLPEPPRLTLF